jgi:hypothetical protein
VPDAQIPGFNTPDAQPNACTAAEISQFLTACTGGSASPSACSAFQIDGGPCVGCLLQPNNTGGVLLDSTGTVIVGVNTPGCIALADPDGGTACAVGLEPFFQCESQACGSADCRAADAAVYLNCLNESQAGACATQYASSAACAAAYSDGGAAVGTGRCSTPELVVDRICGTGK